MQAKLQSETYPYLAEKLLHPLNANAAYAFIDEGKVRVQLTVMVQWETCPGWSDGDLHAGSLYGPS